jgi:hypothetical protein
MSEMITISKKAYVIDNNLVVPMPNIPEGMYQVVIVLQARPIPRQRRVGFSKARFSMSADFNAPLVMCHADEGSIRT